MKRSPIIACVVAAAVIMVIYLAWPRSSVSQEFQPSMAAEFVRINQKLDTIIAGQGRMNHQLDRVWEDTRRRR